MYYKYYMIVLLLPFRHHLPLLVGVKGYNGDSEESLSFKCGDLIHPLNTDGHEKWFGMHKDTNLKGYFPRTHVREKLERMRYVCSWHPLI